MKENVNVTIEELETMADSLLKAEDLEQIVDKNNNEKEDDNEEEKEESIEKSTENEDEKEETKKSLNIDELVASLNAPINELKEGLEKSISSNDDKFGVLAKSIKAVCHTQGIISKSISLIVKGVETLNQRLEEIERQPSARKSIDNISVHNKNFSKSTGTPTVMSKSQMASILSDELFKGNPKVKSQDVIAVESGAQIRPELIELIENKVNR